jgi:hypothetical protein
MANQLVSVSWAGRTGSSGTRRKLVTRLRWIAMAILSIPILIVIYEAARLTPEYLNYVRVSRSLDQVAAEFHEGDNPENLKGLITQHFKKEKVQYPDVSEIAIRNEGAQWVIEADYSHLTWLFPTIKVQVSFDKVVRAPKVVTP